MKRLSKSKRSWLKTFFLCMLAIVAVVLLGGGSGALPPTVPTNDPAQEATEEDSQGGQEGDEEFSIEEPQRSKSEREAIRVANRVAVLYGEFPNEDGDLRKVAKKQLGRIKPYVTDDLYRAVRIRWTEGRTWSLQYFEAEIRPGAEIVSSSRTDMEVIAHIRTTLVGDGTEATPVDTAYQIQLVMSGKKWKASAIASAGEG